MKTAKKKKGVSLHHIKYGKDEIVVELPSRGAHWIITSFQSMSPNSQNIKWLKNVKRAVSFIIKQKIEELNKCQLEKKQ